MCGGWLFSKVCSVTPDSGITAAASESRTPAYVRTCGVKRFRVLLWNHVMRPPAEHWANISTMQTGQGEQVQRVTFKKAL